MATEIYLGYPPDPIRDWMLSDGSITPPIENPPEVDDEEPVIPPMGTERWVPACNPDGSPLSEAERAEWVFSDRKSYYVQYNENYMGTGFTTWEFMEDEHDVSIQNGDTTDTYFDLAIYDPYNGTTTHVYAYRKYTPGHWEDADGNWINGSWGEWETSFQIDWFYEGDDIGFGTAGQTGWYYMGIYLGDVNANILNYDNVVASRTWTSTKPAPVA